MGSLLRRTLVILLAAVFVAAGIGRGSAAAQPCPSTVHETAAHHAHDGDHHHAQPHDQATKQAAIDHSCLKCCGICIAIANGVSGPSIGMELILSSVLYLLNSGIQRGQLIVLDPGIPKTTS